MDERVWNVDGMILTGENEVLGGEGEIYVNVTTNSTRTGLGSNPKLHGGKPATNHLSHDMTSWNSWDV
jgi:hypothetical protein